MATKRFSLHTEPHVAEIGDDLAFEFRPEVDGDEFLDAYSQASSRASMWRRELSPASWPLCCSHRVVGRPCQRPE